MESPNDVLSKIKNLTTVIENFYHISEYDDVINEGGTVILGNILLYYNFGSI